MKKCASLILLLLILNSCYFGAGVVEVDLPGNYFLFGNNSLEENAIWFKKEEHIGSIIVEETVFAVGFNDEFIIAKSFPRDSTKLLKEKDVHYHILKVNEEVPSINRGMTFKEYKLKREELNVPYDLNFSIVFQEVVKN